MTEGARSLGIIWRGPLDSCNYACVYCPFAKRSPSRRVLDADREALERFVSWVQSARRWDLQILITPYGEALIWPWYRDALVRLSHVPHVRHVAIQTNASGPMTFVAEANTARLSLFVTWHPSEVALEPFVAKIGALHAAGTRLAVGMVAAPSRVAEAQALHAALPTGVSFWLNAQKPGIRFSNAEKQTLVALDPTFRLETRRHLTRGERCHAGEDVIAIDGEGDVRRCHFVDGVLGNLFRDDLAAMLAPRACTRATCECFIGYVNVPKLGGRAMYDDDRFLARLRSHA